MRLLAVQRTRVGSTTAYFASFFFFFFTLPARRFVILAHMWFLKDLDRALTSLVLAFISGWLRSMVATFLAAGHTSRLSRTEAMACVIEKDLRPAFSQNEFSSSTFHNQHGWKQGISMSLQPLISWI